MFLQAGSPAELRAYMAQYPDSRCIAGGTDIMPVQNRENDHEAVFIDISGAAALHRIVAEDGVLSVGAAATFTEIEQNALLRQYAPVLCLAASQVGSPQIRNLGTIGGNVAHGSPAADTLPVLAMLDAEVRLYSATEGTCRDIPVDTFITGPGQTLLRPGEYIEALRFSPPEASWRMAYEKVGRRNALAISRLSACCAARWEGQRLTGLRLRRIPHAAAAVRSRSTAFEGTALPCRGNAGGRAGNTGHRGGRRAAGLGQLQAGGGPGAAAADTAPHPRGGGPMKIGFTLNGAPVCVEAPGTVSLLTLLRDYCRLTGTKRGCDIGECGACTVLLDDRAVTSCMVMAGQVQGRRVVTIEGLTGHDGALSPLQQAFVDHFAVQCGFCTPGMIMSATALLHEDPHPSREKIRRAISGNLCRCTGYDAIVDAIDAAAAEMAMLV